MNRTHDGLDAPIRFHGGQAGAVAPFALFLAGVGWLGLSGAPDERGFWPILLAALALGLGLARDRGAYSDAILRGMAQPLVMVMVMAWLLAGVLGALMNASGFVEALVATARGLGLGGGGFVVASFLVSALVATATGTSLGTLLLCGPLLYPAGGSLGAEPAVLLGAILGGATFGDNVSPVSDTTIASATTQGADLGGVVKSRLRYALPAAAVAMVAYGLAGGGGGGGGGALSPDAGGSLRGLVMIVAPVAAVGLLLAGRHLVEGLMAGVVAAAAAGLASGLIAPADLLSIDAEAFIARGLILEGMERAIGVTIFTILLMGVVTGVEASGVLDRLVGFARDRARSARGAEWWIFSVVSGAVLLTTHSVVAILTVARFTDATGKTFGVSRYRRANILDITVCTYPFLLPFFIPTILAASTTVAGTAFGMPRLSPFQAGLYNFHSWALLAVVVLAIATGFGAERRARAAG